MPDLVIRNATLPDGRTGQDVLVDGGRITAVGPALAASSGPTALIRPPSTSTSCPVRPSGSVALRITRSGIY